MSKWVVEALLPILGALAVLLGVIALGRVTRAALHERPQYTLSLSEIECQPPQGIARADFLREVGNLSPQLERLHRLDAELPARLAGAFAAHPWVEAVERVETHGRVYVRLIYREAVLAVALSGSKIPRDGSVLVETWSGMGHNALVPARAVDRHGVLLPVSAPTSRLPVLVGEIAAPAGAKGRPWGDPSVTDAAATVAFLRPHLQKLRLGDCDLEIVQVGMVFRKPNLRVVWGHAPGREQAGEAPASVKLQRLLDYQSRHDSLESLEHDVRLLAHQGHFPLAVNGRP